MVLFSKYKSWNDVNCLFAIENNKIEQERGKKNKNKSDELYEMCIAEIYTLNSTLHCYKSSENVNEGNETTTKKRQIHTNTQARIQSAFSGSLCTI